MTPPIRVRRRHTDPTATAFRARLARKWPWTWWCQIPGCDDREPWHMAFGCAATQPAARDAGLAHLATHTETR